VAKSANIRELAKRSGVSVATVSRVFNNYPDVSEETRRRVLELAEELEYTPSAAARTLVMRRSQLIGVLLDTGPSHPDIQHPVFQAVLVGLKHHIGEMDYDILLFATETAAGSRDAASYVKRCRHHRVDGVVLMGVEEEDPAVQRLVRSRIPCVAVDLDLVGPRTSYVTSDNGVGARMAVEHLAGLGHTKIGFISGPLRRRPSRDRLLGYTTALAELGLPYREELVRYGDFYPDSGHDAMAELLELSDRPTAVFAASDLMAVGAMAAAAERGLAVPDDVAIVGFDDIDIASLTRPALTTVRQQKEGLGVAAAEMLARLLADESFTPTVVTLPVELIVRESCGAGKPALAGAAENVAAGRRDGRAGRKAARATATARDEKVFVKRASKPRKEGET
jgi:LacI family transcriptional regulator